MNRSSIVCVTLLVAGSVSAARADVEFSVPERAPSLAALSPEVSHRRGTQAASRDSGGRCFSRCHALGHRSRLSGRVVPEAAGIALASSQAR